MSPKLECSVCWFWTILYLLLLFFLVCAKHVANISYLLINLTVHWNNSHTVICATQMNNFTHSWFFVMIMIYHYYSIPICPAVLHCFQVYNVLRNRTKCSSWSQLCRWPLHTLAICTYMYVFNMAFKDPIHVSWFDVKWMHPAHNILTSSGRIWEQFSPEKFRCPLISHQTN